MKLEMESKEIKDLELGVNSESNSQHKEDSVDNSSGTSINDSEPTVEIASNSKEEKANKVEEPDASMAENSVAGSVPLEGNLPAAEEEEANKVEEPDVSMAEDSVAGSVQLEGNLPAAENTAKTYSIYRILDQGFESSHVGLQKVSNRNLNIGDSQNHRQSFHYDSDDSSDCDEYINNMRKDIVQPAAKVPAGVKSKGELLSSDLPTVEDLTITENVANLQKIGEILKIVINPEHNVFVVVVQSDENLDTLAEDSILFLSSGEPLGMIHELYGNVPKPKYTIRFNKPEDIHNRCLTEGQHVFYSPANGELTRLVLVAELRQQKGSDASWKDNNEPPAELIDYSDDEQEKVAKQRRRARTRNNDRGSDPEEDAVPNKVERRRGSYNQERAFPARPPRSKFRSPIPGPSRSSPHTYSSPRSFRSTPSPPSIYNPGTSGLHRNALWSQPCGSTSPNNRFGFLQRSVSPQSFGPFPQSNMSPPQPLRSFLKNWEPSYQSFAAPPTSHVFAPPYLAPGAPQQNPASLLPASQNNVPLQQHIVLQLREPNDTFLSHPPPNFNTNQNSRTFLHQNHSFTSPTFGAAPATVYTMPSTSNQSFVNQVPFSIGTTNGPHNDLSGNLNISQSRGITQYPINSNGHQGPSYGMVQSSAANSYMFPSINTQHNNIHTPVTQSVFGPNQSAMPSPCPTPPIVLNQSTMPSPCPTSPFILCPTPPHISTQQGFPHPPVLLSQTPPPTIHPFPLPVMRNPMPPPHYPY